MADKLVFPIGFDLESGLKQAQGDITRVIRRLDDAVKNQNVKLPVGFDAAMANRLREEAKDIDRVLANIKNHYGNGQLKGLSIGFIDTSKELEALKRLHAKIQELARQRQTLVDGGATEQELKRIDSALASTSQRIKNLNHDYSRDNSFNVAISQQIIKLKNLSEELAGIDRMYARLQASAGAAGRSANTFEANEMLARRKEVMEEIARVTRTATEAQKELFNIKGVGIGASQSVFGYGGAEGLSAINAQIERYGQLKKELQDVEGQYERLKAMQAQGMGDQSEKINQTLQRRIAIQKELGDITQTAAQAQKALEENAKKTAAAFQRGRSAIDNFNRTMKLPENRIMNIQAKINALNQALKRVGIGSTEFNKIVAELNRLGQKLDEAKAKQQALSSEQEKGIKKATGAFREQHSYLSILIQRLAVYTSMGAVMGFLTKVREVTAQFELQRISLGAIINDQVKANSLFNEIKQFALKSPVKILDLVKYTKQMAAFRFETDTLFESTKRMADISVGLSVPMDRLILALGHVKAATHLTGITLRQFSMAGIPMLELLAEKYSELEGRAVSVADVQKRVHDKMVSFEDVNQVFTDLTSKGGMFYNMQEKQGNTLYGLWAKLGDAASVMYDQIGNTSAVSDGMKSAIQALTTLMREWKSVGKSILTTGGITLLAVAAMKAHSAVLNAQTIAIKKNTWGHLANRLAIIKNSGALTAFYGTLRRVGVGMNTASAYTIAFSKAIKAVQTVGFGALVLGIGVVIEKLFQAYENAHRLRNALNDIEVETTVEQDKSVRNFEHLAQTATDVKKSTKERRDALEELQRTYKKILPQEVLELGYLQQLKGNYISLTNAVREYVAEQQKRKAIDTISEEFGSKKLKLERRQNEVLRDMGWSEEEIARFWTQFYKSAKDKSKSITQVVGEAVKAGGHDGLTEVISLLPNLMRDGEAVVKARKDTNKSGWLGDFFVSDDVIDALDLLLDAERELNQEMEQLEKRTDATANASSRFAEAQENLAKQMDNVILKRGGNGEEIDRESFLGQQMMKNFEIKGLSEMLKTEFETAGLVWDDSFANIINKINSSKPELISSLDFGAIIDHITETLNKDGLTDAQRELLTGLLVFARQAQQRYMKIIPSDPIVRVWQQRFRMIANAVGEFKTEYNQYLMQSGEDLETYNKRLHDSLTTLKATVKGLLVTQKKVVAAGIFAKSYYGVSAEELQLKIDETNEAIAIIEKVLGEQPDFSKNQSKSGTKSDDRLSKLQEILSTLEKINTKYEELRKKEGDTKALKDIQKMYANTLEYANKLGKQFGLKFEMPTVFKDLQQARESVLAVIRKLRMKGYEKAALDLEEKIGTGDIDKLQKEIEKKLKELADRISRTKTAREFYEKILNQTGDIELAARISLNIYGEDGWELREELAEQVREYFKNDAVEIEVPLTVIGEHGDINYAGLEELAEQYKNELGEKSYEALMKIVENGKKDLAKKYADIFKQITDSESYAYKYLQATGSIAAQIRDIRRDIAAKNIDEADGNRAISGLIEKELKEVSKLDWEAFKGSRLYLEMFEDVAQSSTASIEMMQKRLRGLTMEWGNVLNPTQLKEIREKMRTLDEEIIRRNPWKQLRPSLEQYKKALASVTVGGAVENMVAARGDYYAAISDPDKGRDSMEAREALKRLNIMREIAKISKVLTDDSGKQLKGAQALTRARQIAFDKEVEARAELAEAQTLLQTAIDRAEKSGRNPNGDPQVKAAQARVEAAEKNLEVQQGVSDNLARQEEQAKNLKETIIGIAESAVEWGEVAAAGMRAMADLSETLGADEEDVQFFNDLADGVENITSAVGDMASAVKDGNVAGIVKSGLMAIPKLITGFSQIFHAGKIRRANKEIKRQQEILEQLEYTYGRLEEAAEKLFGGDYISNYNQQMRNLQAQQTAYLRMAQAERSKGKKADKAKIKEYEDAARETADEIKKMENDLTAHFTGTDQTSLARDFAQSWIEAKATFASTTDAIKSKYKDMIQSMIVEGAAAKVIDRILSPMWDQMNSMLQKNDITGAIDYVVNGMDQFIADADNGMNVLWKSLEARGYDMKKLLGESDTNLTGISRDIATASEESINGLAGHMNTVEHYVALIQRDVAQLSMGGGLVGTSATQSIDYTSLIQQSIENQSMIARNTAETAAECKKIVAECKRQADLLNSVIVTKGQTGTRQVYIRM